MRTKERLSYEREWEGQNHVEERMQAGRFGARARAVVLSFQKMIMVIIIGRPKTTEQSKSQNNKQATQQQQQQQRPRNAMQRNETKGNATKLPTCIVKYFW
mmetsp:Transcript_8939/g.26633  ORF Transcript_8939/g.26633 Transcript_8939/m.26633 type:complete len:101 (-) Transcript_8939:550-852(-)